MLVKLKRSHPKWGYVGLNNVDVADEMCPDKQCFSPHNYQYTNSKGKVILDYRCKTREYGGCPE